MIYLFISVLTLMIAAKDFNDMDNKLGWFGIIVSACNFSAFLLEYF
jgi:hypothetical protein